MTKVTAGPRSVPSIETCARPAGLPASPDPTRPAEDPRAVPRPGGGYGRCPGKGYRPGAGLGARVAGPRHGGYASGRTTALIGIEPAPARVTFRPGRGAWTIAPSPTYMPTWVASSK